MSKIESYNAVREKMLKRASETFPEAANFNFIDDFGELLRDHNDPIGFVKSTVASMVKAGEIDIEHDKNDTDIDVVLSKRQFDNFNK
ncbi:hypothetical protein [Serratia fonticola]